MICELINFLSCFWEGKEYESNKQKNNTTLVVPYNELILFGAVFAIMAIFLMFIFVGHSSNAPEHYNYVACICGGCLL